MSTQQTLLDPNLRSSEVNDFETALRRRVVGQDRAVRSLARAYQVYLAGLAAPGRPLDCQSTARRGHAHGFGSARLGYQLLRIIEQRLRQPRRGSKRSWKDQTV